MLPHGDSPHHNRLIMTDNLSYPEADIYGPGALADYVVVPNSTCAMRYRNHLPASRIRTLGSPRYCKEWIKKLDTFAPTFNLASAKGKCKIAFFLRSSAYPLFWEEIYWFILLITRFLDVHLAVVPHSRSQGSDILGQVYSELEAEHDNLTIVEEDVYSGAIVKWADIIIDIGTSMAFEAVVRGKSVLCPEYLHATRAITGVYFPKAVANCRDDLLDMIVSRQNVPGHCWHSPDEAEIFIQDMIHVPDSHVLQRYVDFLQEFYQKSWTPNIPSQSPPIHEPHETRAYFSLVDKFIDLRRHCSLQEHKIASRDEKISDRDQIIAEFIAAHIRMRWTQLMHHERARTVLLFGEKTRISWLLDILNNTAGPEILGIVSTGAEQKTSLDGIPVLRPKQAQEAAFDAIVLATGVHPKSLKKRCLELFPADTTVVDLCDIAHTPHYLKMKREMHLADGDYVNALEPALTLLDLSSKEQDFMSCYKIGLELHKQQYLEQARAAYEKIAVDVKVDPALAAWAFFKLGEMFLDQGKPKHARVYFSRALQHNPKHSKAAILLTPLDRSLRVYITDRAHDQGGKDDNCIVVEMNTVDPELWQYYFARRHPDHVLFRIDMDEGWQKVTILAKLLWHHIAPEGSAEILFSNEPQDVPPKWATDIFQAAGFRVDKGGTPGLKLLA
jgi:TolA-binding protein